MCALIWIGELCVIRNNFGPEVSDRGAMAAEDRTRPKVLRTWTNVILILGM